MSFLHIEIGINVNVKQNLNYISEPKINLFSGRLQKM